MPELQSPAAPAPGAAQTGSPGPSTGPKSVPANPGSAGSSGSPRIAAKEMSFAGHNAYIVDVAKVCRESSKFTDVKIQCEDGDLSAHR